MRVQFAVSVALALALSSALAQPQLKVVGVFALLSDSVQVTAATDAPSDTRIERTARETLEFKGIGFDPIALRVSRDSIQRAQPAARVLLFSSPVAMTAAEQDSLARGAAKAELPDWMVKTIVERKLSHVLLVTRTRAAINARTANGHAIGRGSVEGIGFFIDTLYQMKNLNSGAVSTGLLAPYIQVKLSLMDTQSAEIVASYHINDAFAYASRDDQVVAEPWSFMSAADKVVTLRDMVDKGMQRAMQSLLARP